MANPVNDVAVMSDATKLPFFCEVFREVYDFNTQGMQKYYCNIGYFANEYLSSPNIFRLAQCFFL